MANRGVCMIARAENAILQVGLSTVHAFALLDANPFLKGVQ